MNKPIHQVRELSRAAFAQFTADFLRLCAAPSPQRPTVRCLTYTDAVSLALQARELISDTDLRSESGKALISLLTQGSVLTPLNSEASKPNTLVFVVGGQAKQTVDPLDILMALCPAGVVCYFSALQYFGLTTQLASHHHVARLNPAPALEQRVPTSQTTTSTAPLKSRNPLGTLLFTYQSVPYYRTTRNAHTIAGTQLRTLSDKTLVRITTREQTLLDTLHRPLSCGGSSVVWEAWSRGLHDIDATILTEHLHTLNDSKLVRRVGYMLQFHNLALPQLAILLENAKREAGSMSVDRYVPLMPGIPCSRTDAQWGLRLP